MLTKKNYLEFILSIVLLAISILLFYSMPIRILNCNMKSEYSS